MSSHIVPVLYDDEIPRFVVEAGYGPAGDQPKAIETLVNGLKAGERYQTLRGVTGSGKTYTMAKIIEASQMPTLVVSHNKTLAAQLYREFKEFFPKNAVEYFVSYYDYYQPEAYVASRDLYIEKDSDINEEIDKLRLAATASLLERPDVIVVSTVSCIYGLGSPRDYRNMRLRFDAGQPFFLPEFKVRMIQMLYERNDATLTRGSFRVKGDVIDIHPSYADVVYRIELDFEQIRRIRELHPVSGETLRDLKSVMIYPAKHFVLDGSSMEPAIQAITEELKLRVEFFDNANKLVESQRIKSRTEYDIEMLREIGHCPGIENYSRHLTGRVEGERPAVLLDYFPEKFLTLVDESHVTLPQIRGMYFGDRARKTNLVDYGFRLPSALDNRPLFYEEFHSMLHQSIFVSATPSEEELKRSKNVTELIIRPTGLLDPEIDVRPSEGQIEDLYTEIRKTIAQGERTLVTTLTKKMAEDLTTYLSGMDLKVRYLHSEVETFERVEILTELRTGTFDVLVGINLLREGLDLPEVSLVVILDADKIGFLRSATSLIQTIGRAARNVNGRVIMYADRESDAMKAALDETKRRRAIQLAYNEAHGITPSTVKKAIIDILQREKTGKVEDEKKTLEILQSKYNVLVPQQRKSYVTELERQMLEHAKNLEFEQAAILRDEIDRVKSLGKK